MPEAVRAQVPDARSLCMIHEAVTEVVNIGKCTTAPASPSEAREDEVALLGLGAPRLRPFTFCLLQVAMTQEGIHRAVG